MSNIPFLATLAMVFALFVDGCDDSSTRVQTRETDAGLTYSLLPIEDAERVAINIAWRTDWAQDPDLNPATPYVASDLVMSGGAGGQSASYVLEELSDLGVTRSLFPNGDYLRATISVPVSELEAGVAAMNKVLAAPSFDQNWLERVREGLQTGQSDRNALPVNEAWNVARYIYLRDQPLRRFLSLDEDRFIEGVTVEDAKAWHDATVTRNGAMITVAGDVSGDRMDAAIDALFDGVESAQQRVLPKPELDVGPRIVLLHRPGAAKTVLSLIGPVTPTGDEAEFADLVISGLMDGPEGILAQDVRDGLGAAYEFQADFANYTRDLRFFFMTVEVETSQLRAVLSSMRQSYKSLRNNTAPEGVTALTENFAMALEKARSEPEAMALAMMEARLDKRAAAFALALPEALAEIDARRIAARLSTYPTTNELTVVAVSPDETALPGACVIVEVFEAMECPSVLADFQN